MTPSDSKASDSDRNGVPRNVSFACEANGCTKISYSGVTLGRPIAVGQVEQPLETVLLALGGLPDNPKRYAYLGEIGTVWTRDEDLVEQLLSSAETRWTIR